MQSGLLPFPGCQGSFGIVPNGFPESFVSSNILECYHVDLTPTLCDYYFPTASVLEIAMKVVAILTGKMDFKIRFSGVFSKTYVAPAALFPKPEASS